MGPGSPRLPVLRVQPEAAVLEHPAGLVGLIWYMPGEAPITPTLS